MARDSTPPDDAPAPPEGTPAGGFADPLLDQLGSGLIVLDRGFHIQQVNRHMADWLGCTPEAMVGQACFRLIHQREEICHDCPVATSFRTGQPATTTHTGLDAQGRATHAEIIAVPIRDASGQVVAALESVRDVTERERHVAALAESVRRLEASEAELRRRNEELVRLNGLLGRTTSVMGLEAVAQKLLAGALEVIHPEAVGAIQLLDAGGRRLQRLATVGPALGPCDPGRVGACTCAAAVASDRVVVVRDEGIPACLGGPAEPAFAVSIPLSASERVLGVLAVRLPRGAPPPEGRERLYELIGRALGMAIENAQLYDRTDAQLHRKVVELTSALEAVEQERARALASEQAKQELVTMFSHDLRSPLTVIYSDASEHGRACQDDACRASRASVRAAVRRANAMLGDVVDSARLEGGTLELEREPLDLAELLRDLAVTGVPAEDRPRLRLGLAAERAPVLGDRSWLDRAVANVVGNALKFTPAGLPVEVRLVEEPRTWRVEVADRGPGIPEGEVGLLFRRFYRASNALRTQGSGLGLYITRLVVEAHGGWVSAESALGMGATITLTLPRGLPGP